MPEVDATNASLNDPKVRTEMYMKTHGIKELFEGLGTELLFQRPKDPRKFLITKLKEMKEAKSNRMHRPFFTEEDLEAMFAAFDITNRGYITTEQYDQALLTLGIEQPTLRLPESITTINSTLFMRSLTQEIKNASLSFM